MIGAMLEGIGGMAAVLEAARSSDDRRRGVLQLERRFWFRPHRRRKVDDGADSAREVAEPYSRGLGSKSRGELS